MIARRADGHSAAGRTAHGRVPCNIDVVAVRARGVLICRDHWLIVKVVSASFEREIGDSGISLAAVS